MVCAVEPPPEDPRVSEVAALQQEVAKLKAAGPNGAKSFKRYDELLEDNRKLQV